MKSADIFTFWMYGDGDGDGDDLERLKVCEGGVLQRKAGTNSKKSRRHWCPQKYCSKAMKEIIQVSLASATLKGALKEISKTEMREIQMV